MLDFESIQLLFIVYSYLALSIHAYIIDDADPTVRYTSYLNMTPWATLSPTGLRYLQSPNGSVVTIDYTRLNNKTVSFANCLQQLHCQIEIPFIGTGVTVYGVLLPGVSNFTVYIDESLAAAPPLYPLTPQISPPLYNVTLYDLQGLSPSPHNLTITIVSWQGRQSEIAFDYADVNGAASRPSTNVLPSVSPSQAP